MNNHSAFGLFQSQAVAPPVATGMGKHLGKTIHSLSMLLEYEQKLLTENQYTQMEALAADKHRLLGQLETVMAGSGKGDIDAISDDLQHLREKLARNMQALKFRAKAIGELAQTIEDAMDRAQGDGTYDPMSINRYGK